MPILDVQIVGNLNSSNKSNLAQEIADAAGRVFRSGKQETWVKVEFLSTENYAENEETSLDILPVFVHVVQRELPNQEQLIIQTIELTKAISSICKRLKENVHIIYEPPGRGRVAFGGSEKCNDFYSTI